MAVINKDFEEIANALYQYRIYLNIDDLRGPHRASELNFQRAIVVYFLKKKRHTLQEIGAFLNRGHANVINALKYKDKKHGRDSRYELIISGIGTQLLEKAVLEKIKYHELQIEELQKELKSYSKFKHL